MKIMRLKKMKFQMMYTCLTLQSCNRTSMNPVLQKSPKENCPEKNHQIHKTPIGLELLSGVLVVNLNEWLLMQKAFAAWINMKFVEVISKLLHLFLKFFTQ